MPLQRKTPMRRTAIKRAAMPRKHYPWARNPKPAKPMRQKSAKGRQRDALYAVAKKEYMAENPLCEAHPLLVLEAQPPATELHHKRGRAGSLLWDKRFFMSGCGACHKWIHNNPAKARELGLLAPASEWNVVPRGA